MNNSFDKYREFTPGQFMLDDDFIDWVKCPADEQDKFWSQFLIRHPHQAENVQLAKKMLSGIQTETVRVDDAIKDRIWNSIRIQSNQNAPVVKMRSRNWLIGIAALFILIAGIAFFRMNAGDDSNRQIMQTAFGEKKTIVLPDNSTVVLNAASRIEFENDWSQNSPREVWVDGEAFFEVVHKNKAGTVVQPSERFIVHLKNMDVEVLGTTFSVNTRRNSEQVVLQTGSVKVNLRNNSNELYLKPGEMVQYNKEENLITKQTTNASDHASWKDNRLKFDNTSLDEVIKLIEDNYGYTVIIADSSLLDRTISGTLSSENERVLFKALETMLDVKISVSTKTVTISKK